MADILLIDDEIDILESMTKVLSREGHNIHSVAAAAEGLTYMTEKNLDLVITDLIMAGVNGVDVIKHIREAYPETKVIAISGGGNFGSAAYQPNAITTTAYLEAAADAGADAVLTKPFERSKLVEIVEDTLKK
jgi:two-component system cell cycle response regulator CpdR